MHHEELRRLVGSEVSTGKYPGIFSGTLPITGGQAEYTSACRIRLSDARLDREIGMRSYPSRTGVEMRIAFAQMDVARGDRQANFKRVDQLVREFYASGRSADIFLLPELWSTGYVLKDLKSMASEEGKEEAEFLGNLARKYNTWFAGGSVAAKTSSGIYNRAQIIDRRGTLQAIYDKVHLVPMLDEPRYLAAGDKYCLYTIEDIRFGFAICYDLRFCEFIRKLALDGAEVLLIAAQWPSVRTEHWKILLKARAIENQCYLFAANSTSQGPDGFAGNSMGLAPDGSILCRIENETAVESAVADREVVAKQRIDVPVFQNRRPELY